MKIGIIGVALASAFVAAAGLTGATPARAAEAAAAPNLDPAAAPAGTYKLDPRHSIITGTIMRQGLSRYVFHFDKFDVNFDYDPKKPEATKVMVTLDPASLSSKTTAIDEHVRSNEFFDVMKFPQVTFVSTAITRNGNKGTMTGNLSFVGVTKPMTLDVTYNGATIGRRTNMGFMATTVLKISDFGPVGVAFAKMHSLSDEVPLQIDALFDKM